MSEKIKMLVSNLDDTSQTDDNGIKKSILSVGQFRELARPTSLHIDESEVMAFVRECEDAYIIPAIGYANYKSAAFGSEWDDTFDDSFNGVIFVDGGEWTYTACNGDKELRYNYGLRKALAYFVYAKMLRADGTIISRTGAMRHRDEYGDHVDDSKLKQYNDVMRLAEHYLASSMDYYKYHLTQDIKPAKTTRARIIAIGD